MKVTSMVLSIAGLITLATATPGVDIKAHDAAPISEGLTIRNDLHDLPFPLVPAMWSVDIGGKQYTLNGTAQSVHAQLDALHPDWRSHIPAATDTAQLKPRVRDGIICCSNNNQYWPYAGIGNIFQAIDALDNLGPTICTAQARSCIQIACYSNDGVVLCNDNWVNIGKEGRTLSAYANDLVGPCQVGNGMCGQEFDTEKWNIIVKGQTYPGCVN